VTTVEQLRWIKFPVLNDGFVCLVDVMGKDSDIVQAARTSYGKDERECGHCHGAGEIGTEDGETTCPLCDGKGVLKEASEAEVRRLIRYLLAHRHTTPFEMAELKFLVRVPMDCWRQWIRHRTASVNEYSTRYTKAIDSCQEVAPDEWRLQSGTNKQGSAGLLEQWPEGSVFVPVPDGSGVGARTFDFEGRVYGIGVDGPEDSPGAALSRDQQRFQREARDLYETRLALGVAREQARSDLPLSNYTEAYWKIDLHNLLHFLGLRMDSHAQYEIRQYATTIGEQIVAKLFPVTWSEWLDVVFNSMRLTATDISALSQFLMRNKSQSHILESHFPEDSRKSERREFLEKLRRLGFHI
jgi:thymidylate synthase (FAD)